MFSYLLLVALIITLIFTSSSISLPIIPAHDYVLSFFFSLSNFSILSLRRCIYFLRSFIAFIKLNPLLLKANCSFLNSFISSFNTFVSSQFICYSDLISLISTVKPFISFIMSSLAFWWKSDLYVFFDLIEKLSSNLALHLRFDSSYVYSSESMSCFLYLFYLLTLLSPPLYYRILILDLFLAKWEQARRVKSLFQLIVYNIG